MAGVVVTVHRVGADSAGPLDSVRTDARGRYALRFRRFGDENAIYFAAVVYRGIAYFSDPLHGAHAEGAETEITVFDTTTRAVPLRVQGHHVVVGSPRGDGEREIVEVWELSNDTTLTLVGGDSLAPVWTAPLPRAARRLAGGQGDVSPSAIDVRRGRAALVTSFGPGIKQVSYSYALPASAFPLQVPVEEPVGVFEVLVEEPAARVHAPALRAMDAATTQGRTFKRFLGQDVPAGSAIRIEVPTPLSTARTRILVALALAVGAAMAVALALALRRRYRLPDAARLQATVAAQIAALDARQQHAATALPAEQYAAEREVLRARLAASLAPADR